MVISPANAERLREAARAAADKNHARHKPEVDKLNQEALAKEQEPQGK